ncbi:uncharacterized protein LOC123540618 [Mercenaria mercenaria]|uniref:uncharacterized protein LOC123540618 n=1 Tax=Mercenaria mercenaria TaxID=6596 RepID=UPI00234F0984|nr:uncharacterized protein LOC123540618 [Mercenaria mercenaria]
MYFPALVLIVLAAGNVLPPASAFFLDSFYTHGPSHHYTTAREYSHCTRYSEYNSLANLMRYDECMNIDSVFELLVNITRKEHTGLCRLHVIKLLAGHFGAHAKTPASCTCHGRNQLHVYKTGADDGVPDLKEHCLSHDSHYKNLYNQFFKNGDSHGHHHGDTHVPACRTHHTVWSELNSLSNTTYHSSSCQKDIIFHLQYYFSKHADSCTCTGHVISQHTNGQHGSGLSSCLSYSSYNALLQLGNTNGCLSANSVWHYLDDLQVKDPSCRQQIQNHLADKYTAGSHYADACTCTAHKPLVNHEIHRMANGSYTECKQHVSGTYKTIESELFSNIRHHGCRNHDILWTQLQGIRDHCSHYYHTECRALVDCTQDLIVRAAVQYPNDESDSCVCSQASTTTQTTTTARKTTTTSTTAAPTTRTAAPTTTKLPVSTQPAGPPKKFSCNELLVVERIAQAEQAKHQNASACDPDIGGSDDAYVLSSCNMTSPVTWRKGANVMADCESNTHLIPGFTPISTFSGERYHSLGSQPGIFLECYNAGFKMAIQKCNGVPEIVHIEDGVFLKSPHNYYVIV